ncbi:hypothetical protein RRG08_009690 [Elysia crispata]|uniref:Uncharacterized protein n=1 Tax=Elysia crispata TaxID=231223 RepID=A0AAE0XW88_9GAST|nr:hypothetical protein RRG08_009690 [Elysia crispata]
MNDRYPSPRKLPGNLDRQKTGWFITEEGSGLEGKLYSGCFYWVLVMLADRIETLAYDAMYVVSCIYTLSLRVTPGQNLALVGSRNLLVTQTPLPP